MTKILTDTEKTSGRFELYIDLDGVLADFSRGMTVALQEVHGGNEVHQENQYEACPRYRRKMWYTVEVYQGNGGELWYDLELMEDALILWEYIKPHNPQILSATGDPRFQAEPQKRRWVAEKFGEHVVVNLTRKAAEKSRHAASHRILIDDKMKAIDPWRDRGGIGVLHTSAADTIRQLQELGL